MSVMRYAGVLAAALALASCAQLDTRYDRSELDRPDQGLVLGEFALKQNAIVDGDTVKVDGLDASLRLLAIDTEETFKSEKSWRAFEQGWERYLESEQAKTSRPIKVATPLGMEAKYWAQDFFAGVTRVRLERDHPREVRGRYNRFLAYVFVERDGEWVNYNIEAVRAGMSPYFTKYGYSRRFHAEFVAAEAEAKAQRRGLWADGAQCYPDYDVRERWWDARAEFVARFEIEAAGDPDLIALTNWDAKQRLAAALGDEVEVLATVGDVRQGERGPKRVMLSRRMFDDFPIVFWDEGVYAASGIEAYRGEYVRVRGVVTSYVNRRSGERQLQMEIRDPGQVRLPKYVPPGQPGDPDLDPEFELRSPDSMVEEAPAVERPADLAPAERRPSGTSPSEADSLEPSPSPREPSPREPSPSEPKPGSADTGRGPGG